jgi:DNA repair protein RecO (recombination protein O)
VSLYKTKGIVLRTRKLGEADKIVTLYTNTRGKVDAVAKGIRRTKSKFGARLEPFSLVSLLLYEGRSLDIISQAETIDSFKPLREDLERLTYASAALELIDKLGLEGESGGLLFGLLQKELKTLAEASQGLKLLIAAFNFKAMSLSGYRPDFTSCSNCQEKPGPPLWFNPASGGILCHRCAAQGVTPEALIRLSLEELDLLRKMIGNSLEEIVNLKVVSDLEEKLFDLSLRYINYHLQLGLKSHAYIGKNQKSEEKTRN